MNFRDVVGSVSASTLGYILGGFRGAKAGFRGYNSYQNMLKRKASARGTKRKTSGSTSGVNTTIKRIKVQVTNNKKPARRRVKSYSTKGCKPLTPCLKKQIKNIALKTIHSEQPRGKYILHYLYRFPQVYGSGATPAQNVVTGLATATGSSIPPWSLLVCGEYRNLIDAISVLFNGKTANFTYTAVGDATPSQMIVPDISHLAVYEFTNNTLHEQVFLMYETLSKEDTDTNIYSAWSAMSVPQEGGTTRGVTYFGMRPEMYPQFKDAYRIVKKTFKVLKPGERMKYVMKVRDKHLKFDKWMKAGTTTPWRIKKNFTKELLIINWARPIVGKQTATSNTMAEWNCADVAGFGITIQKDDYITLRCPENITTVNAKDNALCVLSGYEGILDPASVTTVVPRSITVVSPAQ